MLWAAVFMRLGNYTGGIFVLVLGAGAGGGVGGGGGGGESRTQAVESPGNREVTEMAIQVGPCRLHEPMAVKDLFLSLPMQGRPQCGKCLHSLFNLVCSANVGYVRACVASRLVILFRIML